jgi:hypothetical protein
MPDSAWLSLVERSGALGVCELCATSPASLESVVLVRHDRGGSVQLVACDRCTRAMRRVMAVIGGGPVSQVVTVAPGAPTPAPAAVPRLRPRQRPRVQRAEVIAEFDDHLVDAAGTHYVARAVGGPRAGGTWVGWLEFVAVGERRVRRTGQETTQPDREALIYWASGLEPTYLEGAFERAR